MRASASQRAPAHLDKPPELPRATYFARQQFYAEQYNTSIWRELAEYNGASDIQATIRRLKITRTPVQNPLRQQEKIRNVGQHDPGFLAACRSGSWKSKTKRCGALYRTPEEEQRLVRGCLRTGGGDELEKFSVC